MIHVAFVIVAFMLAISTPAYAQQEGYKVSAVSVGSGQTPISGGISASVNLTNETGGFIQVMAQSEQGWFMMGKDFAFNRTICNLYGSVGYFQGAPWVGPYAACDITLAKVGSQKISVGALTWPGWYIGREPTNWRENGTENGEPLLAGYFSSAQLTIGGLTVSIAHLNFLDDPPNVIPGAAYTHKVQEGFDVNGSLNWDTNGDKPMFFVGATWRPNKQ